ncbi:predicted protein [Methanosarcina acetivorans C2A]|uniref:Uncharacterized protein n=1 Tax=Methanosarcina acetivorans (strain ATCC 35395 / DSM 2834 / JCM 12185 / C2A) TaxID=188937 RepID=Q8TKJ6_METAC|nr:predicted protein [Methanosarcina acetivorans C2A]
MIEAVYICRVYPYRHQNYEFTGKIYICDVVNTYIECENKKEAINYAENNQNNNCWGEKRAGTYAFFKKMSGVSFRT